MTTCSIDTSLTRIKDDLLKGINPLHQIKNNLDSLSNKDIGDIISSISNLFETKLVDGKDLKLNKGLLDSSGKINRYVWAGTNQVAFTNRATDVAKNADLKKYGKDTRTESEKEDNLIKAEKGTAIHSVAEYIMQDLIEKDTSGLIEKNTYYTKPDIKKLLFNLNSDYDEAVVIFNKLKIGIKEILEQIKEKQLKADPTKKAVILTERTIFDIQTGGTVDLMYILSNKKAGIFDYKSINPYSKSLLDEDGNLISDKWISHHKQHTMNLQLSKLQDMIKNSLGLELEMARIVPIQVHFEFKKKKEWRPGSILKNNISSIKIGKEESEFLKQIPMIKEEFDSKTLNQVLDNLLILKNNLVIEINSLSNSAWRKKNQLENRLRNVQSQINNLQVDKDLDNIYQFYQELVNRYSSYEEGTFKLKNIEDQYLEVLDGNGQMVQEKNPDYLSLEEIRDLEMSLKTLLSIIYSTEEFMKELNITDKSKFEKFREIEAQYIKRTNYMLSELSDIKLHRVVASDKIEALKDSYSLGKIGFYALRPSEQNNVLIQTYNQLIQSANDDKRLELQTLEKEIESFLLPLQQWGKNQGKTGFSMYDILIDKQTGNLHNSLNKDFFKYIKEERLSSKSNNRRTKEESKKNILQFYSKKDNFDTIYGIMRENFIKNNEPDDKTLAQWEKKWAEDSDHVVFENINIFYKLDYSKIPEKYFTKEYLEIKKHKAVFDFYNFWEKSMYKFLHILEVYGDQHYSNFIPWIKVSTSEALFREGTGAAVNETLESLKMAMGMDFRTEDTELGDKFVQGKINPGTGEIQRTVPRFFLNPLFNNEGQIDTTLKSFDLAKSLFVFGEMALNYKYKTKIEASLETLKDIALTEDAAIIANDLSTKIPGGTTHKLKGVQNEIYDYIDNMLKYNLYGIHFDDNKKSLQNVKWLFAMDRFNKKRLFSLNINSAIKAQTASRLFMIFESIKGVYFTRKMVSDAFDKQAKAMIAVKQNSTNKDLELMKYFAPYSESITPDRTAKLSVNPSESFLGMNTEDIVNMLGKGDRMIDNTILLAILQNYGIQDGKLIRLNSLNNRKGTKSLYETSSIKDGKLSIEGILDNNITTNKEIYTQFRQIVLNVATSIKGNISQEDANILQTNMWWRLFMSLRTFIPALTKERFEGISYNQTTKEITVGRYSALFQNIGPKEKSHLSNLTQADADSTLENFGYIVSQATKQFLNFGSMLFTYGIPNLVTMGKASNLDLFKFQKEIAISEHRSKAIFENYKAQFPNTKEIQDLSYEDFANYKLAQIRTMAVEITFFLAFLIALKGLKNMDWDDDDKKDYVESKALRFFYKNFLGTYRELSFFINPTDWTMTAQSISPILRLINDSFNIVTNGYDETRDLIFGENSKSDSTPFLYYTTKMIPYISTLSRQLEIFEQDRKVYW